MWAADALRAAKNRIEWLEETLRSQKALPQGDMPEQLLSYGQDGAIIPGIVMTYSTHIACELCYLLVIFITVKRDFSHWQIMNNKTILKEGS